MRGAPTGEWLLSQRGLSDMNAGFWIKLLPAASVYKCEPPRQRESKLGPQGNWARVWRLTMSLLRPFVASG